MPDSLHYDSSVAASYLSPVAWDSVVPLLENARAAVRAEVELYNSRSDVPRHMQPLGLFK